ncbi:hypothetical protein [Novosphingobium sp.]|uniref:hypothetical protein n=1 Tax=Novosphingobium sp. TaxID=1874826 RepID=UPI0025DD47B6|nr:hypothetical protein [Novosphingobium sp.]
MKSFDRALTGALALATLMPLTAYAQSTPPADATTGTTATAPLDSTTPPADSAATTTATSGTTAPPASAAVTSGATVYGSDGAPVGTIASVAGGNAVVDTGSRKATLALNAFGSGPQGPTITVTKSQLEDAVEKATPPAPAASEPPAKAKKKGK